MLVMIAYSQNEDAKVKILLCEVNNFLDVESLKTERKKRRDKDYYYYHFLCPLFVNARGKRRRKEGKEIIKLRERCQFSKCDEPLER